MCLLVVAFVVALGVFCLACALQTQTTSHPFSVVALSCGKGVISLSFVLLLTIFDLLFPLFVLALVINARQ